MLHSEKLLYKSNLPQLIIFNELKIMSCGKAMLAEAEKTERSTSKT